MRMMVNLIFHRQEGGLCIDIEELDPYENAFAFYQRVRQSIDLLQTCETAEKMFQQVSEEFFHMSVYDRVMMYKFHEDYHGEVMTEFCTENIKDDSWLGLHYPATDIPQRSRDQFKASSVRIIVNCRAPDSPILMAGDEAGDSVPMTMSSLRPAHSCHKEYLVNMGVTASIASAIIVKDQLWGLMIGHHMKPKFVSFQMRMACEFLVQAFSMALTNLLDTSAHARHERSLQLHSKLCDLMYQQGQVCNHNTSPLPFAPPDCPAHRLLPTRPPSPSSDPPPLNTRPTPPFPPPVAPTRLQAGAHALPSLQPHLPPLTPLATPPCMM